MNGLFQRIVFCFFVVIISAAGCSRSKESVVPPNVLFISIDTLRRDHLGCYGYRRQTSPNIDRLADSGVIFENMMSSISWTMPSHASMLTGKYPAFHGLQDDGVKLSQDIPTLQEFFRNRGYYTLAVVSHVYVSSAFGLERGFDIFDDSLIEEEKDDPIAEQVVDRFIRLVQESQPKRLFGFIHLFDPHWPYTAPEPYKNRFIDPDYTGLVDGTYESFKKYESISKYMPEADRRQMIGYYDGEIAYVDSQIGRLVKNLKKLGLMDNTVLVITSDHGEEFKEHGQLGHGKTLYEEQLHVPLIIAGHPAFPPGARRKDLVSTCDLAPTLLELADMRNLGDFQGTSILRAKSNDDRTLFSETMQGNIERRAVRLRQYKMIYSRVPQDKRISFFDLQNDPFEINPLEKDLTGGLLSSAMEGYNITADSGWHLKLIALHHPLICRATIFTSDLFVNPRHYFSKMLRVWKGDFTFFEVSPDRKTLKFSIFIERGIGEVIFDTESPKAPVTFKIEISSPAGREGIFLGKGNRVIEDQTITLTQLDSRVKGLPDNYLKTPTGVYIRAVRPIAESAPKAKLSEEALERLKSLGYIQ